jgi:hypothetical protein
MVRGRRREGQPQSVAGGPCYDRELTPSVPIVQRPRTWPFQGQNPGSNPGGDAKFRFSEFWPVPTRPQSRRASLRLARACANSASSAAPNSSCWWVFSPTKKPANSYRFGAAGLSPFLTRNSLMRAYALLRSSGVKFPCPPPGIVNSSFGVPALVSASPRRVTCE